MTTLTTINKTPLEITQCVTDDGSHIFYEANGYPVFWVGDPDDGAWVVFPKGATYTQSQNEGDLGTALAFCANLHSAFVYVTPR